MGHTAYKRAIYGFRPDAHGTIDKHAQNYVPACQFDTLFTSYLDNVKRKIGNFSLYIIQITCEKSVSGRAAREQSMEEVVRGMLGRARKLACDFCSLVVKKTAYL